MSKKGSMKAFSTSPRGRRVQQRDLENVVLVEHLAGNAQLFGHQAAGRDAAAFAVAAVAHLDRRLVDVLAAAPGSCRRSR